MKKAINDYQLIKSLGNGSFGQVYLTKKINDNRMYATKILDIQKMKEKDMSKYMANEIKIMKELNNNENIIRLYELFKTNNNLYFIMEYCNGGSLMDILNNYKLQFGRAFSQEIIQHFMRQIVNGIKYTHSHKIIHRDMKLENILIHFNNEEDKKNFNLLNSKIKIIDFGLATKLDENGGAQTLVGSPLYMDPIILKKYDKAGGFAKLQVYNEKADIWSIGVICYEMLTGETLFNAQDLKELMKKVEEGNYNIPLYVELSNEIISFLNAMLQYDGEKRWSAEKLSTHSFLKNNVKDFTKINLEDISYKIKNGLFEINIKNNKSIWAIFNKEEKQKQEQKQNPQASYTINIPKNSEDFSNLKTRFREAYVSPKRIMKRKNIISDKKSNEQKEFDGIKKSIMEIGEYEKEKKEMETNATIEKINKPKDNDKWGEYINGLLDEYKSVKYYFEKNKLNAQEKDADNKILEIQNIKNEYKKGNLNYLSNLPKPITPEYVYGYSTSERNQKFKILIDKFIKDKNNLIAKLQLSKKFAITKNLKEDYEKLSKKINNLNIIIQNTQFQLKNKWAPSPNYSIKSQETKVEKISYDNCDFKLRIEMKSYDNRNEEIDFNIYLLINNKKNNIKYIQLKSENNFCDEYIHSMKYNEWKNIGNNTGDFILSLENEKIVWKNSKRITVNISNIKNGKNISFNVKLPTKNNNLAKILFNVKPIIPEGEKKWTIVTKDYLILKKIYPPFEGKSKLTSNPPSLS